MPKINAVAPWFGSSRMIGEHVGTALHGCNFVAIPFGGGMCELAHIDVRSVVISDLHCHVINLANVIADPLKVVALRERLDAAPFHDFILDNCQEACRRREDAIERIGFPPHCADVDWAFDYFVCSWMARNGKAGTKAEFSAGLSVRWDGNGGDSATRFRNATAALAEWSALMRRCTFVCLDAFEMLAKVKDEPAVAVYADPPWHVDGAAYKHTFSEDDHRRLAAALSDFANARVVVRAGDHPFVRMLYSGDGWRWTKLTGRTAANKAKAEVLIVRNGGE